MVMTGIIEPISEPSPAVSPLVVVFLLEEKGDIRICMDPTELNKNIRRRNYPLKTVEEVAAKLLNSKVFSKIDCMKGFWQVKVSEESSKYLTIATEWGRYKFLRLPFGISSAPEVFSELMNKTLQGIPNVEIAMDDVLIHAENNAKLNELTKRVISTLHDKGVTLNPAKCEFNKTKIKFLGHIFSSKGCEADPEKIKAIDLLQEPTNVKELQRLLGMVTYLSKFIKNLSIITEPIRILLRKNVAWHWEIEQKEAFKNIKSILSSTPVLQYYNVNSPVKLSVDASSKALGACLMQEDHPIAYATRALTLTEQNYPQLEKEALAIQFACKKFHEYVFGKQLNIETDHKPLESIFKKPLQDAPPRLQKILWNVMNYSPTIKYVKGTSIPIADALSRDCQPVVEEEDDKEQYRILALFSMSEKVKNHIIELTQKDDELQLLKKYILEGWRTPDDKIPEQLKSYLTFKCELSEEDGILFKANKIIVPVAEREKIVKDVHKGHAGINTSLVRARQSFFWPGMSKEIKEYVESCSVCQQTQRIDTKPPLLEKEIPQLPFQNVSSDLFQFKNDQFLLIADHYSGFFDIAKLKTTKASEVITILKKWFSVHGSPEVLETDGGPQYVNAKFRDFTERWDIQHRISSPHYPRSNGFAERNVQTAKNLLKKCSIDNTDIYEALLVLRNTNRSEILQSPVKRLFSRATRSFIPINKMELAPNVIKNVAAELKKLRHTQKLYADRVSSPIKIIKENDKVRMQIGHRNWIQAKVVKETPFPRSVIVQTNEGKKFRRNTSHLHITKADIHTPHSSDFFNISSPAIVESKDQIEDIETSRNIQSEYSETKSPNQVSSNNNQGPETKPDEHTENRQITKRSGRIIRKPKRFND